MSLSCLTVALRLSLPPKLCSCPARVLIWFETSVFACVHQLLKLDAGIAARRVGVADRVAVQRRQHRTHPRGHVLDGGEVQAHLITERIDARHELGGGFDLLDQLVSAELASGRVQRIDQALHARRDPIDLGAHITEAGGQRSGPVLQSVEIFGVVADDGRACGHPVADDARLIGGPELLRHDSGGPGEATDEADVRQLADPLRHLLQVGQRLRRAEVARRRDEDVFGHGLADGEMALHRGIPDRTRGRRPHGLAVVVVVAHQGRAAGEDNENEQAGNQMGLRPPHDANSGTPPEPGGQFASRPDPAARPGKDQDGGQQRHRGEVSNPDPDRARHTGRGEHAHPGEADAEEGDSDRGGGCGDHLADRDQRPPDCVVEICALPQIVVVAADQEDGVIRSGARDDRAQKDGRLVRHTQPEEFRDPGHHGLCDDQGRPDRRQRQQHGDRIAVHQQQDEEHKDADRDLDGQAVLFAGHRQVGDRRRGPGDMHGEWAVGRVVFDEIGDPVVGLIGPRRAQLACKADRQHPRGLVLAGQKWAQLRRGEEVLNHHDVGHVVPKSVHHLAVGVFVGGFEPGFVDECHDEKVVATRFLKRLGHLAGGHARRGIAGQDGGRMPLGHVVQARKRQKKCHRDRRPCADHRPGPLRHELG